ncbi:MAG: hypothetical protein JSV43_06470 [Methanobacteriota archaeon]|nr:MAG: hypothetical protein JSV43_06470 [Euryarchaeota archaeon]
MVSVSQKSKEGQSPKYQAGPDGFVKGLIAISVVVVIMAVLYITSYQWSLFSTDVLAIMPYILLLLTMVLLAYVIVEALRPATPQRRVPKRVGFARDVPTYVISSMMLEEWHSYLVSQNDGQVGETMCFACGVIDPNANTITPCGLLTPKMSERSWSGVVGDPESVHEALSKIDRHLPNHALALTCHLHPGHGPNSVLPSMTDRKTHRDMEKGGYPVIGAIFSEDGFVHFYSGDSKFNLMVTGGGVEDVGNRTYRIHS